VFEDSKEPAIIELVTKEKKHQQKMVLDDINKNKKLNVIYTIEETWHKELAESFHWMGLKLPLPLPDIMDPPKITKKNKVAFEALISRIGLRCLLLDGKLLGMNVNDVDKAFDSLDKYKR
jgi:hypothetical protein